MVSSCSEAEGGASVAGEASSPGGQQGPAAAQVAAAAPSDVGSTGVGQPQQLPAEPLGAAAPWVDLPSLLLGHILSFLFNEDPGLVRRLQSKGLHAAMRTNPSELSGMLHARVSRLLVVATCEIHGASLAPSPTYICINWPPAAASAVSVGMQGLA